MQQADKRFILTAVSLAVLGGMIHQTREIDAAAYRALRNDFKEGTPEYRSAIAAAMLSGDISRWEYWSLLLQAGRDNSATVENGLVLNLREERLVLAAMTRQFKAP